MLLVYLLLVGIGVVLTRAVAPRSRAHMWLGVIGTILGVLAVLTGFSIGPLVAILAAGMLLSAATGLGRPVRARETP